MDTEVLKALLNLAVTLIALGVTWSLGSLIAMSWATKQKQRELELASVNQFYANYGEFCAVWKLWNHYLDVDEPPKRGEITPRREELLKRASAVQGAMEASLLRLTSESLLEQPTRAELGNLRQAFQVLFERIRDGKKIPYVSADHSNYLEFKQLATRFGVLLASGASPHAPNTTQAYEAFREITDNKYEAHWR